MPRWVLGIVVVPLALCVTLATFGYFVGVPWAQAVVSKSQTGVSNAMADAVATSVSRSIEERPHPPGRLVLAAVDLNVNNAVVPGNAGIEVSTDGTRIYGIVTEITPTGIALVIGEGIRYSAVPVVEGGRVALTEVEVSSDLMRLFLSKDGFARSLEQGINRALDAHGLTPTSITLRHGAMTILTKTAP